MYAFKTHDEVPMFLRNYLMSVVHAEVFSEIDLHDANSFLNDLEAQYQRPVDSEVIYRELAQPVK